MRNKTGIAAPWARARPPSAGRTAACCWRPYMDCAANHRQGEVLPEHWAVGEHKPAPCECGRKDCVWLTDAGECLGFSKKVRAKVKKQPTVTEYSEIYLSGYSIVPFKAEPSPLFEDAADLQIQAAKRRVRRTRSYKRDLSTSSVRTVRADQQSTSHKAKLSLSQHGHASLSGMRATRAPERSELSELPAAMASAYFRGLSSAASPTVHGCDQLLGTTEFPANGTTCTSPRS